MKIPSSRLFQTLLKLIVGFYSNISEKNYSNPVILKLRQQSNFFSGKSVVFCL